MGAGQGTGQHQESRLGRRIRRLVGAGDEAGIRCHVHDRAAAGRSQSRDRLARDEVRALEVRVQAHVPVDLGDVLDPSHHVDARVVHDDVEPAGVVDLDERG